MLLSHKHRDALTLRIQLPHVSQLLVFADNWNNAFMMRKVIAEILANGFYKKMFIGQSYELSEDEVDKCEDCAIINITLKNISNSVCTSELIEDYFIHELQNKRNAVQFESRILNREKNMIVVDVIMQVAISEIKKADTAAA